MNYFVIGPIYNFSFEQRIEIKHEITSVNILRNHTVTDQLLEEPHLTKCIGLIALNALKSNNIHFSMHKFNLTEEDTLDLTSPMIALQKSLIQNFFLSLWMVKDNSVNTAEFYWWHYDKGTIVTDTPAILFSNARGEYFDVPFSPEEVEQAQVWQDRLSTYTNSKYSNYKESDLSSRINHLEGINNHNKRNLEINENRIMRSIRLINLARSQSFLPAKIASYISAIEALISSNRESLVMQVSERVPKVIGGSFDEKIGNHDKIRAAYGIRNKYVHGDKVTTSVANKLDQASEDIDAIARALLIKMIDEYDHTKDYGEKQMTKWYEQNFMF